MVRYKISDLKLIVMLMIAILSITFVGCSAPKEDKTIYILKGNWDSISLHNEIVTLIIEHAFEGYQVELTGGISVQDWASLKSGAIDLVLETWRENYPTYMMDVRNGYVMEHGVVMEEYRQGIYVPRYVVEGDESRGIKAMAPELHSVQDIVRYASVFVEQGSDGYGVFHGALSTWFCNEVLWRKFNYLQLQEEYIYEIMESELAMFQSLQRAYERGDAWIGFCYEPTWVASKLDMILLSDAPYEENLFLDGKTAFRNEDLYKVSSRQFPEKSQELTEFIERYSIPRERVSEALLYAFETESSFEDVAVWFLKTHDSLIDDWLPAQNASKLRGYLQTVGS